MATLPDIDSNEKLEGWLGDKPREWAQVVAVRAALRVLPRSSRIFGVSERQITVQQKRSFALSIFRASLISVVACFRRTSEIQAAAAAADTNADTAAAAAISDAPAAASAADAAAAAAAAGHSDSAITAIAAVAAVDAADAATSIWQEVSSDTLWLANRLEQLTGGIYSPTDAERHASALIADLSGTTLWALTQPDWVDVELAKLSHRLSETGSDWSHWIDWYISRLFGYRFGLHPQLIGLARDNFDYRVATQSDEWWERGPDAVNADIARWISEATAEYAPSPEDEDPDDLTRIYELGPEVDSDWDPYEPQDDGENPPIEIPPLVPASLEPEWNDGRLSLPMRRASHDLKGRHRRSSGRPQARAQAVR